MANQEGNKPNQNIKIFYYFILALILYFVISFIFDRGDSSGTKIDELQSQVEDLQSSIDDLQSDVDSLQALVNYQSDYIGQLQDKLSVQASRSSWYSTIPDYNPPA